MLRPYCHPPPARILPPCQPPTQAPAASLRLQPALLQGTWLWHPETSGQHAQKRQVGLSCLSAGHRWSLAPGMSPLQPFLFLFELHRRRHSCAPGPPSSTAQIVSSRVSSEPDGRARGWCGLRVGREACGRANNKGLLYENDGITRTRSDGAVMRLLARSLARLLRPGLMLPRPSGGAADGAVRGSEGKVRGEVLPVGRGSAYAWLL
jgi:hypothetical protein